MQPGKKREPTLKELLAAQGKLSSQQKPTPKPQPAPQQKTAPKPLPVAKPQAAPKARTEEEKKRQAETLLKAFGAQAAPKKAQTKEDKLREMMNDDPEKAAQMLRDMFLKGK